MAKLLQATRKADQLRIVTSAPVTGAELHTLCFACESLGYRHESETCEFIPAQLEPTPEQYDAFAGGDRDPRFLRKLVAGYKERKHVTYHLFRHVDGVNWHCFYFTLTDMFGHPDTKQPHWDGGYHLHYMSRAFWNLDADVVVSGFETGKWKSGEHVAWVER